MEEMEKKIKDIIVKALEQEGFNIDINRRGINSFIEITIDGINYKVQIKEYDLT